MPGFEAIYFDEHDVMNNTLRVIVFIHFQIISRKNKGLSGTYTSCFKKFVNIFLTFLFINLLLITYAYFIQDSLFNIIVHFDIFYLRVKIKTRCIFYLFEFVKSVLATVIRCSSGSI